MQEVDFSTPTKREIQEKLLEMMKHFHKVCEEHQITYYMNSGTMLGAVRHKGFIPWDDDVDLGLFREEYERLLKLPKEVWGEEYELKTFHNTKGYPYCFAKLYNKNTTIVEDGYVKHIGGVYLDIFPHDGAGNILCLAKVRYRINFIRYWLLIYRLLEEKKKHPVKRFLQMWAHRYPVKAWQTELEQAITKKDCQSSRYVANYIGRHRTKEVFPKKFFGTPVLYEFEDSKFYGPSMPTEYLTWLYGDFMKLPPEEERHLNHPAEFISLSLPYREYRRMKK